MNRNVFFAVFTVSALMFSSCGKAAGRDSCGCLYDIDDAKRIASERNQNIVLAVTMEGDDSMSGTFLDNVVRSGNFSEVTASYVFVHFDFSDDSYGNMIQSSDGAAADQRDAEAYGLQMRKNSRYAGLLNVSYTPAFYLISKEGYVVTELYGAGSAENAGQFLEMLSGYDVTVSEFRSMVDSTETGDVVGRVNAIDRLYEDTDDIYKVFLAPMYSKVPEIDKKNQSGLVSKYILAAAGARALEYYTSDDVTHAVQSYISICDDSRLSPEDKQQAYYMAAYTLASDSAADYDVIEKYLQMAVDVYPEGRYVRRINSTLDRIRAARAPGGED